MLQENYLAFIVNSVHWTVDEWRPRGVELSFKEGSRTSHNTDYYYFNYYENSFDYTQVLSDREVVFPQIKGEKIDNRPARSHTVRMRKGVKIVKWKGMNQSIVL